MKFVKNVFVFAAVVVAIFAGLSSGIELEPSERKIVSFDGDLIQLDHDNLISILGNREIKDRLVVAISITGAYRKGKSFLMNFFLKYLNAQYKNHDVTDWMRRGGSMIQGFTWKNGRKPETRGINIWSEVFTGDLENGSKVAIILIDTQGIFDSSTSLKQSGTIFSLSALLSSVQIYNVMQNIQEDDLEHLEYFTEYGRLISERSVSKPFQKLLFVVRDWPYGKDEGYGLLNGERIINETLAENEEQTVEMISMRRRIRKNFDELSAFLLPTPGHAVVQGNFGGDLDLVDDDFKKYVEELSEALFAPKNLIIKKMSNIPISAYHWMHFLENYVNLFNRTDLPTGQSLFEATAKSHNFILADNSAKYYVSTLQAILNQSQSMFKPSELMEYHKKIKADAIAQFQNATKFGTKELALPIQQELERRIESEFQAILRLYKIISSKISKITGSNRKCASVGVSIVSGLGGAGYGALIGTAIFPGLGTALGALLGGAAGGAAPKLLTCP